MAKINLLRVVVVSVGLGVTGVVAVFLGAGGCISVLTFTDLEPMFRKSYK